MGNKKVRYSQIDMLRGICIISMIIYHTVWDLVYIYGIDWIWYKSRLASVWQQSICWTFILLSGFCLPMGKHPVKRGMIVFGAGGLITAVTMVIMPKQPVMFGILTFIGTCTILVGLLNKFIQKRISPIITATGMIINFLLFAFTYSVNYRAVGVFSEKLIRLPGKLYYNYFTAFLGFPQSGFFSTDYFSVIPWIFLFLMGYFAHFLVLDNKITREWNGRWRCRPLEWVGSHSLIIYLLHQPVICGVLWVVVR